MNELILTCWCVVVTISSLFIVGFPLSYWFSNKQITEETWILSPFIGLCLIILFLQNLFYLGLSVKQSFLFLWILSIFSWSFVFKKRVFSTFPWMLLVLAVTIYLLHGAGLLLVGAKFYVGRGWHDQLNYTLVAQQIADYSLYRWPHEMYLHPDLLKGAMIIPLERLGAMIFQSFLTCSTLTDAKTIFEPQILLLPFLIVIVIYHLARNLQLSKPNALLVAAIAGSLPSLAMIHLENFFSQALAIPLLLLWPWIVLRVIDRPVFKNILFSTVILAGITSIYTEFLLLAIVLLLFYGLMKKNVKTTATIIIFSFLFNIGFNQQIIFILKRSSLTNFLNNLYPWTNSIEATTRILLGDAVGLLHAKLALFIGTGIVLLIMTAYAGLGLYFYRKKNTLALLLLGMICVPIVVHAMGANKFAYQYYKSLLTMSALFPLGAILFFSHFIKQTRLLIVGTFVLLFSSAATLFMVISSTNIEKLTALQRGGAQYLLQPDMRDIQEKLSAYKNKSILINWQDSFFQGNFVNGWLSYFARHNNVWITNPWVGDGDLTNVLPSFDMSKNEFVILSYKTLFPLIVGQSVHLNWSNSILSEWQVKGNDWILLFVSPENYFSGIAVNQFKIINKKLSFKLLAGKSGVVMITGKNGNKVFSHRFHVKQGINNLALENNDNNMLIIEQIQMVE